MSSNKGNLSTVETLRATYKGTSAKGTLSAKSRMILTLGVFKEAITEIHNGPAGGYLERKNTSRKIKARFWRPSRKYSEFVSDLQDR